MTAKRVRDFHHRSTMNWTLLLLFCGLLAALSPPAQATGWNIGDVFAGVNGGCYDVYDNNPPADVSVNGTLNANSSGTIVLRFENNVNDANAVSGYIELDNGCRIYY